MDIKDLLRIDVSWRAVRMNLGNCPRCGRLYAMGFRDICVDCVKEIEAEYKSCADYLRETRGASMQEVADATGVAVRQIIKFIREGRISIADAPNMSYPCEVCGIPIRENNMCDSCRARLTKELKSATQDDAGGPYDSSRRQGHTYQAVDKLRKF